MPDGLSFLLFPYLSALVGGTVTVAELSALVGGMVTVAELSAAIVIDDSSLIYY